MTDELSVGVVGAGLISRQSHLPVLTTMPGVRVEWLTDADPARAKKLARAYGVPAVPPPSAARALPACDAVLLAIPVGARLAFFEALAGSGTAVLAEKPFARSAEEHRRLVSMFPPHLLGCAFMRRTYASTSILRRFVVEEPLGSLLEIGAFEGSRSGATRADRTFFDRPADTGGGILAEGGCHAVDQALFITGAAGHEVLESLMVMDGTVDRRAEGRVRLNAASTGHEVTLRYRFSWLDRQPNTFELIFEGGRVIASTAPEVPVTVQASTELWARGAELVGSGQGAWTSSQAFRNEWKGFLSGVASGTESVVSAASCLLTTELVEDLYRRASPA